MSIDLSAHLGAANESSVVGTMARGLQGSDILRIAAEVRALQARGLPVCNLTVGDFRPADFPIPQRLAELIGEALQAGQTNYPPSDGVPELREAVLALYERCLGLKYPMESVIVAGGARPLLYGLYRAVVDPDDVVVYPAPSWNNHYYTYMMGGRGVAVSTSPDEGFMPTAALLEPHLQNARLLALCSPLNPTGTMISEQQLREISELVVSINRKREAAGERPLILAYDQIYWNLTLGDTPHHTPMGLVPEVARWTFLVDGVSKWLAGTGIRVGWALGPPAIISRVKDIIGHAGGWAPRPEQVATAKFLREQDSVDAYMVDIRGRARDRLQALYAGFERMREAGLPVRAIAPQGAIYLSLRFDLIGKGGMRSNDDIRKLLLEAAGFAVVPFEAFGFTAEDGWLRLSVGAVSMEDIEQALPRVEAAIRSVVERG